MSTKDEYMKTFVLYECRWCGEAWYGGDDSVKLEPGEQIALLHMRKSRCKFCRNEKGDRSAYQTRR